MKKKKILAILLALALLLGGCGQNYEREDFFAMDTVMEVEVLGDQETTKGVRLIVEELGKKLSVTDPNSEVYQINHSQSDVIPLSDTVSQILQNTLEMAESTGGALNPALYPISRAWGFTTEEKRVPSQEEISELLPHTDWRQLRLDKNVLTLENEMELDFGAVAKGYASDQCVSYLRERGISSALLKLGGNIYALGKKQDGKQWRIGLQNPDGADNMGTLTAEDEAVIASGSYQRYFEQGGRRYHHIMDGTTGRPAESGLVSVTIVCESGWKADALSTALFVMGLEKGVQYWQEEGGFEAIFVTEDRVQHYTKGLEGRYQPAKGWKAEVVD